MEFNLPPHTPLVVPKVSPNGHWDFPVLMEPSNYTGFIYAIYDKVMGQGYIGKKHFHSFQQSRKVESDWKSYMSSSNTLKTIFQVRPKDEFDFICLEMYTNRGDLSYAETWSMIHARVLESNAWYNGGIESVGWKVKRPPTARHKERLEDVIRKVNGKHY